MKPLMLLGTIAAFHSLACSRSQNGSGNSYLYVTNNDVSSLSIFRVDGAGALQSFQTLSTSGGGATYCEVHPSGRFLFVSAQVANTVSSYAIDPDGTVRLVAGSTVATGANPHNLATDPAGRFLYVANTSSDSVSGFSIRPDGTLVEIAGSPFATGHVPYDVKVSGSGRYAYVTNRDSEDISIFALDTGTGKLTPVAPNPFPIGCPAPPCGPRAIEFTPDGKHAFVINRFSSDVYVFAVDGASGTLQSGAAPRFFAGTDPRSAAVDPSGRYLYVPNTVSNDVSAYAIDRDTGALAELTGSPYAVGAVPLAAEMDAAGRRLYVANSGSNSVSVFSVDSATGRLAPVATMPTPGSAFSIALAEPDGN